MSKDVMLPQGKFKIGRDLEAGIYLIAGLNDLTFVTVIDIEENEDMYTLNSDNSKMVHVELEDGYILEIEGKAKVRQIKSGNNENLEFNLFKEIEQFEADLKTSSAKKKPSKTIVVQEKIEDSEDYIEDEEEPEEIIVEEPKSKKHKSGFWSSLASLLSSSPESSSSNDASSSFWSSSKKKDTGRCDGDCANCPPHYGYRYGRWYYGKDHTEGCTRGGNRGGGGII